MALGMAYQLRAAPDGAERRFVYVSESCMAINGIAAAAAMADPRVLYDLILPEDQARMVEAEAEAFARRSSFDIEVRMRRPDGQLRWSRIASTPRPTPLPDGALLWDGIQVDITEKKLLELEAAEQRRRLDLAVEATGLGFWEWDIAADRLVWSERNRDLLSVPPGEPIDIRRYMEAVHPDDRELVREAYRRAAQSPRGGDFSMEYRVQAPDGEVRWILAHARIVAEAGRPRLVVGTSLDVTERRETEERRALLTQELAHRAKNGLTVVAAIANQTARGAASLEEFRTVFNARMQAMAQSQDLITESGRAAPLGLLFAKLLEPFDAPRFRLDPRLSELRVSREAAFGVALLIHELATNAVKYGALSSPEGRVEIAQVRDAADGLAHLEWRESGGPPVAPPTRRGFGSRLIETVLRGEGGGAEAAFEPSGFRARLDIPCASD